MRRSWLAGTLALALGVGAAGCGEGAAAPPAPVVIELPPPPEGACTRNADCAEGEACLPTVEGLRCGVPDQPAPLPAAGPLGQPTLEAAEAEAWRRMGGGE